MIILRLVSSVVEIRDDMEAVYCSRWRNGQDIISISNY
jgi:hypothetical protein